MRFARRTESIGESATLKMARRASELRRQGVDIADFGAGEPDFPSPRVAVEAARRALADGFTKYTPAAGTPELREALARSYRERHGAPWEAGEVVVTVGAKGALFELALALFDAGDEVVIPAPCWVSFAQQVNLAGATPVLVPMDPGDGFTLRAGPIIEAITDATRAVILNSPANPTGGVVGRTDLEEIVETCAARGVLVIADETYERFVYEGEHHSAAALAPRFPETVVVVGSFSKTYSMTGWRIGFTLGRRPLMNAVANIQGHATSNATSFAMVGALAALEEGEADVARMIAEYRERRRIVVEALSRMPGVICAPPAGAFYAFPDVSSHFGKGRRNSAELTEYLLEEGRVAVVPGSAFGADRHIRISFACGRETLKVGLERMTRALGA